MTEEELQEVFDSLVRKGFLNMSLKDFQPIYCLTKKAELYLNNTEPMSDEERIEVNRFLDVAEKDLKLLCGG